MSVIYTHMHKFAVVEIWKWMIDPNGIFGNNNSPAAFYNKFLHFLIKA